MFNRKKQRLIAIIICIILIISMVVPIVISYMI